MLPFCFQFAAKKRANELLAPALMNFMPLNHLFFPRRETGQVVFHWQLPAVYNIPHTKGLALLKPE